MIFKLLEDIINFPNFNLAEPDGLLAIGGDLSEERLLLAYQSGIFPWFSEGDPILWYAPHERCVIFPNRILISKSMRKVIKSGLFRVTVNEAFEQVISACAEIPRANQNGTWITSAMQIAYKNLHRNGHALSVEVWQNSTLVGGLYGVKINHVFCGESMFSKVSNASKVALIYLCNRLNFKLIDCQLPNEHLMSLGAEMIKMKDYLRILKGL